MEQHADDEHDGDGGERAGDHGAVERKHAADLPGNVGAGGNERAVGEVEDAQRCPDDGKAGRHQRVERAEDQTAGRDEHEGLGGHAADSPNSMAMISACDGMSDLSMRPEMLPWSNR